jgi:acetyl coenzyme A synthetase (ADP forming)-like protein
VKRRNHQRDGGQSARPPAATAPIASSTALVDDPARYSVEEVLRDGGSIVIRAIRPDDQRRLLEHFRGLSKDSIYFRFMGPKHTLGERELKYFTELDFRDHVGLVATLREGGDEHILGVGRYVRAKNPARAEIAFAVLDEHHGRGIGTLLLMHLCRIAHAAGITEFEADVLGDNRRMLEVFAQSGFKVRRSLESGIVHVYLPTEETREFLRASDAREHTATAHSIARLLCPRSVAVVGASRDQSRIGGAILATIRRDRFTGPIYPINPSANEVQGLASHPSTRAVAAPVDLAVIAVPPERVEEAIDDCAKAGVGGVVVITAGFAETGDSGRSTERRLVELVRASGMRMVGPNCMGIINTDPVVSLNATFAPVPPPPGNVGMFSESGALGIVALDYARRRRLGLSTFVSAGNRADVSSNDLLDYWADDPRTAVIVLYLEGFGNPRKFARIAPAVARNKPIVAIKAGRSAAGTRAAMSHSAALANLDVAVEALFEQAGVIRTDTFEEMFDVVTLLSAAPLLGGPRVGVVTNAGGPGILFADACEARGLALPKLADETVAALRASLPARAGFANPIDMTAAASPDEYEGTIAAVGADANVDALAAIYVPPMVTRPDEIAAAIARGAARVPADKSVLAVFLTSDAPPPQLHTGPRGAIPCYGFPENAALALAAAYRYANWRKRPLGETLALGEFETSAIRSVVERVLEEGETQGWLMPNDLAVVLSAAGIDLAPSCETTAADAPAAAERLGFPVVAKVIASGVLHKSDVGGVIMGLKSVAEVATAVESLGQRMAVIGAQMEGVLLQREIAGGIEALVGVTTDPTFGPLIVCGTGGVTAEVYKDVAFRLHPVTDIDAREMLAKLRLSRLLDGYRGAPPGDRDALISVIRKISALVETVAELAELDLNPVRVLSPGNGAVVLDARMRVAKPHPLRR